MPSTDLHDDWVETVFGVKVAAPPAAASGAATSGTQAQPTTGFLDGMRKLADSAKRALTGEPSAAEAEEKAQRDKALAALTASNPEAAKQATAAYDKFDKVLGKTEVTPELTQQAQEDRAAKEEALCTALAALQDAQGQPEAKRAAAVKKAQKGYDDAKSAADKAVDKENAIVGRASLTKALSHGPLSAESGAPFKPGTAQKLIAAYSEDARMADAAVTAASTAKFPDAIADQVGPMITTAKGGFAAKDGQAFSDRDFAKHYGADLLRSGGDLGPKFFDRLPDYVASGEQFSVDGAGDGTADTPNGIAQNRSRKLGAALIGPDGGIDTKSAGAKAAVGNMLFHPDAMRTKLPGLSANVLTTMDMLADPTTGPQASAVLKGTKAPTSPGGQKLVRGSMGKGDADPVSDTDARTAVMTTMLQPVDQGPVGSCFTTAPARRMRETEPVKAMQAYSDLASKGTFKPGTGPAIPAVTNLPDGEDPIGRAWEYTAAAAAANHAQSIERQNLTQMVGDGSALLKGAAMKNDTSKNKVKAWKTKQAKLALDVAAAFTFTYDPTVETEKSADGSSSKGRFVIVRGGKGITSKADFVAAMTEVALASLGFDAGSDEGKEVAKVVASDKFATAVCPKAGVAPWQLEGGGYTDESVEALTGTKPVRTELLAESGKPPPPEGKRTAAVLTSLLNGFHGNPATMAAVDTVGQHSFNALPNDPSLDALKGKDAAETGRKVKANLTDKGKAMKDTVLTAERAAFLFDKAVKDESDGQTDPDLSKLIADGVKANRPAAGMKPADVTAAVNRALSAYHDKLADDEAAGWATGQHDAGTPATPEQIRDHKAEMKKGYDAYATANAKNALMKDMGAPEFVIADTNWGDAENHTFFVIAPDPATGEPQLWMKAEPPGTLTPADRDWVDRSWQSIH